MTKRIVLSPEQESELIRRHRLSTRCLEWLDRNGQVELANELQTNQCTISKVIAGGGSRKLTDDQIRYVRRKGKHAKRVRDIQIRHSIRNLRKEYRVTAERIHNLARPGGGRRQKKVKKVSAVTQFLTMALSTKPVAVAGYY